MPSAKLRALIVDDEPLARSYMADLLAKHLDIEIVGECKNGREAVDAVRSMPVDIMFLDIQMPEMSGFDVLENLEAATLPQIVFVTAYDQFAIQAFEVAAVDYLLKPVDEARLEVALGRVRKTLAEGASSGIEEKLMSLLNARDQTPRYLRRLLVRGTSQIYFVKVSEIDFIAADDYVVRLHVGKKIHLLRESVKDLEEKLDPREFVRVHRAFIVNLERIREVRQGPGSGHRVILQDGTELPLSRSRWESVQAALRTAQY